MRHQPRLDVAALIAWATVAAAWLLAGLVAREPWKADEAYSFGLVLSMLREGDYVVPMLAGEPFLEKPPLVFWLAAGTARLFGAWVPLHVAARFADLLLAAASFGAVAHAARLALGRERAGTAVLWLAASPLWLVASKYLTADVGMVFGAALATAGLVRLELGMRGAGAWLGVAAATGLLSKGVLLPAALAVALLLLVAARRELRTAAGARELAIAAAVATVLAAPWPAMLWLRSAALFHVWFWDNNVGRFLGSNELGPANNPLETLGSIALGLLPAWPAAVAALRARSAPLARDGLLAPAVFAAVWVAAVGVSATMRVVYVLPVVAPLALLAAAWSPRAAPRRARVVALALLWAGALFVAGAVAYKVALFVRDPGSLRGSPEGVSVPLALLALAAGAGTVALARRGLARSPLAAGVCSLAFALCGALALFLGPADRTTGYREVMAELDRNVPAGTRCVASRGLGESERAMLDYYAGRRTLRVEVDPKRAAQCPVLLEQDRLDAQGRSTQPGYGCPGMRTIWQGSRPEDTRGAFRLCAAGS